MRPGDTLAGPGKRVHRAIFGDVLARISAHLRGSPRVVGGGRGSVKRRSGTVRIAFFGHFDGSNFGNESSLRSILYHLRRLHPEARVTCICTGPRATASTYQADAIAPEKGTFARSWTPRRRPLRLLRRALLLLMDEPVQ